MARFGGAAQAAKTLGLSLSQFNGIRALMTFEYDVVSQTARPIDPSQRGNRNYLGSLHLVAPALAGHKLPGGAWEFNLRKLRALREQGWHSTAPAGE